MIKAVLFDHDGTLVDSERAHYDMWSAILKKYRKKLSFDEYSQRYAGIPTNSNAEVVIRDYALSVSPIELVRQKNKLTEDYLSQQAFPLMAYALESILFFYEAGIKIGIVTGAGRSGVEATLRENDLSDYIENVVSGDDVEYSKPDPDCYLLAVEKLGVTSDVCVAIEDTKNGVASSVSANIDCIAVPSLGFEAQGFEKANYICEDLKQAKQLIVDKYQL